MWKNSGQAVMIYVLIVDYSIILALLLQVINTIPGKHENKLCYIQKLLRSNKKQESRTLWEYKTY